MIYSKHEDHRQNRLKWIEKLASGGYHQGRGALVRKTPTVMKFCCLGIATTEVAGCEPVSWNLGRAEFWKRSSSVNGVGNHKEFANLPQDAQEKLGVRTSNGQFAFSIPNPGDEESADHLIHVNSLAALNDAGFSFRFIAGFISVEPAGLFVDEVL